MEATLYSKEREQQNTLNIEIKKKYIQWGTKLNVNGGRKLRETE